MKTSELIHNGLYVCGGKIVKFNFPSMLFYTEEHDLIPILRFGTNGTVLGCVTHDTTLPVEPLVLTTEILEANGFTYDDEGYLVKSIPHEGIELNDTIKVGYSESMWDCVINLCTFPNIMELHTIYVHELQRAMRVCGLNDLADNLCFLPKK